MFKNIGADDSTARFLLIKEFINSGYESNRQLPNISNHRNLGVPIRKKRFSGIAS